MKSTYERTGGRYHQEGDYLLPDLEAPERPQMGIWGEQRRRYLQTNKRVLHTVMLLCDTLNDHLAEVNKSASEIFDRLVEQLKCRDCITEELKAYIDAHPFDAGASNNETVLDQLYQAYAESRESDPPEIQAGFAELESLLEILPLDDNNAVLGLCCRLCIHYERKAFLDGLLYGAHLILELHK